MRQEFVECKNVLDAWNVCPWASFVVKAEGGFKAFESVSDYLLWMEG